ncbi:hypothetical protein BTR22_05270 [Alkalihalophilus pseudofirmus]|uniref:hypothetical protein n=1 Tax=Alkalihalophilus pseudofirmus TaxID=79885 RepID=UPI00095350C4|nr:hypothetical protein BTR22_05270 [Alkalihalophilus pseudofirmus]
MNISNLTEGQIIKNYRELCVVLGIKYKEGSDSRKAQITELETYCDFEKKGHKYIITKIFNERKQKIDGRGKSEGSRSNNGKYSPYFKPLLLNMVAREGGEIIKTKNQLFKETKLVNINYSYCGENIPQLSLLLEIDERVIYDFYNINSSNLRSTVESSLKSLENQAYIIYEKVACVCTTNNNHRLATADEKDLIVKSLGYALDDYNFKSLSQARQSSQWKEFRKCINRHLNSLSERKLSYSYDAYRITLNEERLIRDHKALLDIKLDIREEEFNKNELNATVYLENIKSAEKRHKGGFHSQKFSSVRMKKDYIPKMKKLVEYLIDDHAPNIIGKIKEMKEEKN